MKTKKIAISIIALLVTNSFSTFSQSPDNNGFPKNSLQFEATAIVSSYSVNYNRILLSQNKFKPWVGMGLQYFPHSKSHENVYTIYPQIGFLYGHNHHLEASAGASLDLKYSEHLFPIYIGYRFQSPKSYFVFKGGLSTIYLGSNRGDSFLNLPMFFPLPTIGLGVSW